MRVKYPTGCLKCRAHIPDRKIREHIKGKPLYGDMRLHVSCDECGHINRYMVYVDEVRLYRV